MKFFPHNLRFLIVASLSLACLLTFLQCGGNPTLYYPVFLKNRPHIEFPSEIYNQDKIKILIEPCSKNDLEVFADYMGYYTAQKFSRLPELSYFCYSLENHSDDDVVLNLFQSYFLDPQKNQYPPLLDKEYKKKYSSAAYFRFEYDNMYSAYIFEANAIRYKTAARRRHLPNQNATVKPGEMLRQIVPYKNFSLEHYEYTLKLHYNADTVIEESFFAKVHRK